MTKLTLDNLSVNYGPVQALRDFTLTINAGELVALLGPSGCGKTTVLKVVAGLLAPTSGDVLFDGVSILPTLAERRGATMVFQKPLLFPYLTVAENVGFGLKMRQVKKADTADRVAQALTWVRLQGYERRKPHELSGGQEQRVALARALVTEPRVLLLDEPFSALDENLRGEMRMLVRDLQRQLRITTVFVTHDQREALAVADRIALLLDGRIEQCDTPQQLLLHPNSARAAQFFGWKLIKGFSQSGNGWLAFRPETALLQAGRSHNGNLTGKVESLIDFGTRWQWRVRLADGQMLEAEQAHAPGESNLHIGDEVNVVVPENAVRYFALHGENEMSEREKYNA